METVVNNIKKILDEQGMKQKALAIRAGYNEKAFSNMMNGRRLIKADDVLKIANALSVEPNRLFGMQQ